MPQLVCVIEPVREHGGVVRYPVTAIDRVEAVVAREVAQPEAWIAIEHVRLERLLDRDAGLLVVAADPRALEIDACPWCVWVHIPG